MHKIKTKYSDNDFWVYHHIEKSRHSSVIGCKNQNHARKYKKIYINLLFNFSPLVLQHMDVEESNAGSISSNERNNEECVRDLTKKRMRKCGRLGQLTVKLW